jgi:hypothetical protein
MSWVKGTDGALCDVSWHRGVEQPAGSREAAEADALVALAGVAAQWLYRSGTVRAPQVRRDDGMAAVVLRQIEPDALVEERWREYLRRRALGILSEPANQLLIARLGGYLADRAETPGREIHAFLAREQLTVRTLLLDRETTLEERVGLAGHRSFAVPVERLGLAHALTRVLRKERIATVGRLLQYSAHDLCAIVPEADVEQITTAVAERGFSLANQARSNVREIEFSVESICERDERT